MLRAARFQPGAVVLRHRLIIAFGLCVATAVLAAQDRQTPLDPERATFVGETQSVRVDLYVTLDGVPIDDLRLEEVQLLEDGAAQTIRTFDRIAFAPAGSIPTIAPGTLLESRAMAADPRSRVWVVFIDWGHTSYLNPHVQIRFPILETLGRYLGADDLVAVMTPDVRPANLTFDRDYKALAELEGTWETSVLHPNLSMRDHKFDLYASCYPPGIGSPFSEMMARYNERKTLDALENLIEYLSDLRQVRTGVLVLTDGWRLYTENPNLLVSGGARLLNPPVGGGPRLPLPPIGGRGRDGVGVITERGAVMLSESTYRECEADLLALSMVDHVDRLRTITARASRANVSFSPISTLGLTTVTEAHGASTRMTTFGNHTHLERQDSLRALADDTGGLAMVSTNNLDGHFARMMATVSSYYLLGYTPTNTARDGRFRRIDVRVARRGIDVRARAGYFAVSPTPAGTIYKRAIDPIGSALERLESSVRAAADGFAAARAGLGEVRLSRGGPTRVAPYMPTADPRFRRHERLRLELPARVSRTVTARLLDRTGKRLAVPAIVSSRPDGSGRTGGIVVDITLAPLAQGDYLVEIMRDEDVLLTAFRIVP